MVFPSGSAVEIAHVLIAELVALVLPIVLAAAAVIDTVFEEFVNSVAIELKAFSRTRPPNTTAPSVSRAGCPVGPTKTPTEVREELTTVLPRVVELSVSWLPIASSLPLASSRFTRTKYF